MCKPILAHSRTPRKSLTISAFDLDPPPAPPACPVDGTSLQWAPLLRLLRCPVCGWHVTLTPEQAGDLSDTLAGVSTLPLDLFVAAVAGWPVAA